MTWRWLHSKIEFKFVKNQKSFTSHHVVLPLKVSSKIRGHCTCGETSFWKGALTFFLLVFFWSLTIYSVEELTRGGGGDLSCQKLVFLSNFWSSSLFLETPLGTFVLDWWWISSALQVPSCNPANSLRRYPMYFVSISTIIYIDLYILTYMFIFIDLLWVEYEYVP